jgi:hypothetical protein
VTIEQDTLKHERRGLMAAIERLRLERDALKAALEKNAVMLDHAQVIMRKHGFKFETRLDLSEGFEKLAFTFYSLLCEMDRDSRQALKELEER